MTSTAILLAELASGFVPCNLSVADAIDLHKAAIVAPRPATTRFHALLVVTLSATRTHAEAAKLLQYLEAAPLDQWAACCLLGAEDIRQKYIASATAMLDHFASR